MHEEVVYLFLLFHTDIYVKHTRETHSWLTIYLPVDTVFTGHIVSTSPLVGSVVCPVSVCILIREFAVTVTIVKQNTFVYRLLLMLFGSDLHMYSVSSASTEKVNLAVM